MLLTDDKRRLLDPLGESFNDGSQSHLGHTTRQVLVVNPYGESTVDRMQTKKVSKRCGMIERFAR